AQGIDRTGHRDAVDDGGGHDRVRDVDDVAGAGEVDEPTADVHDGVVRGVQQQAVEDVERAAAAHAEEVTGDVEDTAVHVHQVTVPDGERRAVEPHHGDRVVGDRDLRASHQVDRVARGRHGAVADEIEQRARRF